MLSREDPSHAHRAIAIFEATKGLAALAGLIGVLDLLQHDARAMVMTLIGRFGLDPEAPYPSMLLHYADLLPETNIQMLLTLGGAYIAMRFIEATGLWLGKVWGEYLGALSGGIYIPFEIVHWADDPTWLNAGIVLLNVLIVGILTHALWQRLHRTESQ
jgi:uncharacterized membrane protein (DUF2068 family)